MSDNTFTTDRINLILQMKDIPFEEKKMFGSTFFMVDDKMCVGVIKAGLMARVGVETLEKLEEIEGAEQMTHGGKIMKGWLLINPIAYEDDQELEFWVQKCLDFNPFAKASKRRQKTKK